MDTRPKWQKVEQAAAQGRFDEVEQLTRALESGRIDARDTRAARLRVAALERLGRVADALALCARGARAGEPELLAEQVRLLCDASRYRSAAAVITRLIPRADAPLRRRLEVLRGVVLSGISGQDDARTALESTLAAARAARDRPVELDALGWLVLVEFRAAALARAEARGEEALALAGAEVTPTSARVHRHLAVVLGVQHRHAEALEHHGKAISQYRLLGHQLGEGRAYVSLALHYLDMGELELAELYLRKGQDIAELGQDTTLQALARSRAGTLALARNQLEEALRLFTADLELAKETEAARNRAFPLRNVGRALSLMGRGAEAVARLREAAETFEAVGDGVNHALTLLDLGRAQALEAGGPPGALERVQRGRALLEAAGRSSLAAHADLAEAHVRLRLGELEPALNLFRRAMDGWAAGRNLSRMTEANLRFGEALAERGEPARAIACYQRALELSVRTGRPELSRTLLARIDALDPTLLVKAPLRPLPDEPAPAAGSVDALLGQHPSMVEARRLIARVAPLDIPVLVTGESGVGKELAARAVHGGSRRRDAPLVVVNCGAIPSELVESALFGHVKGAFTSAVTAARGKLAAADGGTVFLDEIGELPLHAQAKLLRFLQSGELQRVGDDGALPHHVDVRVVAATHRDLEAMAAEGRFRLDLFYRLSVFPVHLPPLREHPRDLPLLVRALLRHDPRFAELGVRAVSAAAQRALARHAWPGNVRELRSALLRAAVLANGETLTEHDLPASVLGKKAPPARFPSLAEAERAHVKRAMALAGGNQSAAAKLLGVHRNTLRKLRPKD